MQHAFCSCGLIIVVLAGIAVSAPASAVASTGDGWERVSTSGYHFQRCLSSVVYDSARQRFMFFGGAIDMAYDNTVVFYPGNNTFVSMNPLSHPSRRYAAALSYDEAYDCAVLFGGAYKLTTETVYNDTWLYFPQNNSWVTLQPKTAPPTRHLSSMTYDPYTKVNFLFAGSNALLYDDLWSFNSSRLTWTLLENYTLTDSQLARPLNRFAYGMASADGTNSFLVFGGDGVNPRSSEFVVYDDTWMYSYSEQKWSGLTSGHHPSGRSFHAMATSRDLRLTLMFGGSAEADPFTSATYLSDTWVFEQEKSTWLELDVAGPPALFSACLGYDPIGESFYLFGGKNRTGALDDVWRLNACIIPSSVKQEDGNALLSGLAIVVCSVSASLIIAWIVYVRTRKPPKT